MRKSEGQLKVLLGRYTLWAAGGFSGLTPIAGNFDTTTWLDLVKKGEFPWYAPDAQPAGAAVPTELQAQRRLIGRAAQRRSVTAPSAVLKMRRPPSA